VVAEWVNRRAQSALVVRCGPTERTTVRGPWVVPVGGWVAEPAACLPARLV